MNSTFATVLKVNIAVGLLMGGTGVALALAAGWGMTGLWIAIFVFTPISLALEYLAAKRRRSDRPPRHSSGQESSEGPQDVLT